MCCFTSLVINLVEHDTIPTRNFNNLILDQSILDNALPQKYLKGEHLIATEEGLTDSLLLLLVWRKYIIACMVSLEVKEYLLLVFAAFANISKSAIVSFYYCCLL